MSIRQSEFAVAAAKCFLARQPASGLRLPGAGAFHPTACDWCDTPPAALLDLITEFLAWDQENGERETHRFARERPEVQAFLVRRAQGYEPIAA